ncbi:DUF4358 domain-containing protein [Clostridium celatum]|uniref:DUF4358 domain-containing protein n=1 Tax=Clostridium celatum DSM 1785 TaxID=545697 RepID=L1Q9N5_9CLOT|nr:DUF4358 domain-containing protein [Clostridium celatum]EKY24430.1 hypothetical protein HMPREF0216_02730 [Clostridium celatum DSM 1785]MCE9655029.1 DUF4358 domain-containing protein [Clostridium celatum]MDU2266090.1 DUF4358 domain-containing protein [Clostridium celatum]MDU6296338.1 DUF4358 domain-containing protein [Clostridium celatum]MDY3362014.1 DUF4358 domain-containing protein [Clostridium celatum]
MRNKAYINKKKYKKYYLIEIAIIMIIFIGLYPILRVKTADMDAIRNDLDKYYTNQDLVEVGDKKRLSNLYYINENEVEDFVSYTPRTNMDVEEVLVLKVNENKNVSEIKEKINKRLQKQGESFKNYRPEKYKVIEDAILEQEGQYLIFIVSENSSAVKKIIKRNFK